MDTHPSQEPKYRPARRTGGHDLDSGQRFNRVMAIVTATFLWLLATGYCFLAAVGAGLCGLGGEPCTDAEIARGEAYETAMLISFAAGPLLVAILACLLRFVKTGAVYAVLAVALTVVALVYARYTGLIDPDPGYSEPPGPSGVCIEHSGGDTRCPGG